MDSSYDPREEGKTLRMSKSSFMCYNLCPRQYHWRYMLLKDVREPPTPEMMRGSAVHEQYDDMWIRYRCMDEATRESESIASLLPDDDDVYTAISDIEEQRRDDWGEFFLPLSTEQRLEVWDEENGVYLVGVMDGLLLHPDGGLCLLELKTGSMNEGKLSRTRLELCFYEHMLKLLGEERDITHFAYLSPDCENPEFITSIMNRRGKEVFMGDLKGVLIIEKVNQRSRNVFAKKLSVAIENIKAHHWPMKWNDYFCPQWCDYHLSCEEELQGLSDITGDWV